MHQSEQSRDLPTLIKSQRSSILKSRGNNEFYGIADNREGNAISLKFITALGEQKAIHYHDLVSPMDYDGESKIILSTTRLTVTIKGNNLDDLFDHIIQHQVKWIKEPDQSFAENREGAVVITSIKFEELMQ